MVNIIFPSARAFVYCFIEQCINRSLYFLVYLPGLGWNIYATVNKIGIRILDALHLYNTP